MGPTAAHKKRDVARTEMVKLFSKVIAARRADPEKASQNEDILQVFIDMKYKDGSTNTDDQITGLLIALLFAGQHTSSVTSTWTTLLMCTRPDIWKRVTAEVDEVLGNGDALSFDHLQEFETMHNCVREALRLFPPLIMLMRKAKQNVKIATKSGAEFTVPKGDIVVPSPAAAHRLPHVFAKPDEFDPDRYAAGREEHKQHPFAFLGFGGGMHQCMGQQFGFMQVKTIVAVLVSKYELELVSELPEPDYESMVVGPKGKPIVRYKRRKA